MLKIALPNKGRLADATRRLLDEAGLDVRSSGERALTAALGDEFAALFVRPRDIPEFVADGAADAGITGWDLAAESGRPLETLLDLGFGRCRLVLATREDSPIRSLADLGATVRVATVFPRVTRDYFESNRIAAEIAPISGAVEIAPHLGIADVIVDLTETGSTLRVNGLREVATLMESSARLIAAVGPRSDAATRSLDELVTALASVLRARGRRYLMANVPRERLADVRRVVPGLNGPTVVDILNGGHMVAVHAVVESGAIYRAIGDLKALGAEGILVTRIERLVP